MLTFAIHFHSRTICKVLTIRSLSCWYIAHSNCEVLLIGKDSSDVEVP